MILNGWYRITPVEGQIRVEHCERGVFPSGSYKNLMASGCLIEEVFVMNWEELKRKVTKVMETA